MWCLKLLFRILLRLVYRVEVHGLEHYRAAGQRVLIVANHVSFLDPLLLGAFLPDYLTFAVNTHISRRWLLRPFMMLAHTFPLDPTNPMATKGLVQFLRGDRKAVVFPEGRITTTGTLMKIYEGPGLIADKAGATLLPVRIEGPEYTPFSRLGRRFPRRWFPRIRISLCPPVRMDLPPGLRGRRRRLAAARRMSEIMHDMMIRTSRCDTTLYEAMLAARRLVGGGIELVEDIRHQPLTFTRLVAGTRVLGRQFTRLGEPGEALGLLLPTMAVTAVSFMAVHYAGRVPAMINYTAGAQGIRSACRTGRIRILISSRRFVEEGGLTEVVASLAQDLEILYLEDLAGGISAWARLAGLFGALCLPGSYRRRNPAARPEDPAVILFTSGSEGEPKGVVLSHRNLLANRAQLGIVVDFNREDRILNALPLFHSFGLTAGLVLPLVAGVRVFFYPSPLHYRLLPEIAYEVNATILFGTNTFLAGYARHAHPYDFHRLRHVFAGAEKLHEETRRTWCDRFGIRVLEGYGATEASPVLAVNTAIHHRAGTVGRLLPGIRHRLEPVPGVPEGGRLQVQGPNIMLGYLLPENPGVLVPPAAAPGGPGWHDTGDIVTIDEDGFVHILGRTRRFAKIGGEMVSLAAVEELVASIWPGVHHAVVTVPHPTKGEQLVLVTEHPAPDRARLHAEARARGAGELMLPRRILHVGSMPLLGTGKLDDRAVQALAEADAGTTPAGGDPCT